MSKIRRNLTRAGWWLVVSICLTSAGLAQTSTPTPSPPPYQPLRYEEDWSYLSDKTKRTGTLDKLKCIPLSKSKGRGWYLSLGGEARVRYEYFSQFNFGVGPQDDDGFMLQRYLLHADAHLGARVRVFTQLQSGIGTWRSGGPRPTDDDRLEVHQAFIDVKFGDEARSLTVRVGRHEMDFGAGRLISSGEGLNVRRGFDGVRLVWRSHKWVANAQVNKLVSVRSGIFNDTSDSAQTFWGTGVTRARPKSRGGDSVYYIGLDRKRGRFDQGVGREVRHTIGLHSFGQFKKIDYSLDGILQFGNFYSAGSRNGIRAWAFSSDFGYAVSRSQLKPRLGLRADITSGDRNPKDSLLQTFNPLLPGTTYSDTIGLLGATNSIALFPNLRVTTKKKLTIVAGSAFFWRESTTDGIYGINVSPLRTGQLSRARFVGALPSLRLDWPFQRHWSYTLTLSRFQSGQYLKETPPGNNSNYLTNWVIFRF